MRKPGARPSYNTNDLLTLQPIEAEGKSQCSDAATRWLIHPGQTVSVTLQFASAEVTDLTARVAMMSVVSGTISEVVVRACSAYPQVKMDPQCIFPKFRRTAKPGAQLRHCYIMQPGHFDFGRLPIAAERPAPGDIPNVPNVHSAELAIENNGKFATQVKFELVSQAGTAVCTPPAGKPGKGKKVPLKPAPAFSISPSELHLEVGETKHLTLMCFPLEEGQVQDVLKIIVAGNPDSSEFPIVATGQQAVV